MHCIKLVIAYDGTGFCGWQRQKNGETIQEEIERAASRICNQSITVHGAGRTDAGVHALAMTAHFHTSSTLSLERMHKGLNSLLPNSIRIIEIEEQTPDFHARFTAKSKTYRYTLFTGPIQPPQQRLYVAHYPGSTDVELMQRCLTLITGTHDFSSFETTGTRDKGCTSGKGAVRTILAAWLEQPDPETLHLFITGDGFLRHMVRNIAGTVIEVGQFKRSISAFAEILEARDRQCAGATAPAHGLTLISVDYPDETP